MKFLYPSFLYALSLLLIPIIIHLFNFRRYRTIYFSNVAILKEVKQQTQRTYQLKDLLILLTRLLALTALIFVFAQPYIPAINQEKEGVKNISIFIDNSFSMNAKGTEGELIQIAKQKGLQVLNGFKDKDKFQVLTNDFEAKHQRLVNKEEAKNLILEIQSSPSVQKINNILNRQSDALNSQSSVSRNSFIFSDFQKNNFNINNIEIDSNIQLYLIPLQGEKNNNLYIDSCYFLNPINNLNQKNILFVDIINNGSFDHQSVPFELHINNVKKSASSFNIDANSSQTLEIEFIPTDIGINNAVVNIVDYPITFDNKLFFNFLIKEKINVLEIKREYEKNPIALIFNDEQFNFRRFDNHSINYSLIQQQNLIILNRIDNISSGLRTELELFLKNNGSLLILPLIENTEKINSFLKGFNIDTYGKIVNQTIPVTNINYEDDIYKNVFELNSKKINLPIVSSYAKLKNNHLVDKIILLSYNNEDPYLVKYPLKNGKIYLFSSSLNESSISKHAIFLPTLYSIALNSIFQSQLYHTIGSDEVISLININNPNKDLLRIKNSNLEIEIIPEQSFFSNKVILSIHNQIKIANNYLVQEKDKILSLLSFNYNRNESNLEFYSTQELKSNNLNVIDSENNNLEIAIVKANLNNTLWFTFLIFAITFLLFEILLIKLLKK